MADINVSIDKVENGYIIRKEEQKKLKNGMIDYVTKRYIAKSATEAKTKMTELLGQLKK